MTVYQAYILCPNCRGVAANIFTLPTNMDFGGRMDRFALRTDTGKPGPSHRLVVCQHCHYPFKAGEAHIIHSPRTVNAQS